MSDPPRPPGAADADGDADASGAAAAAVSTLAAAVAYTHDWFAWNSGWAPPPSETLADWRAEGVCRTPDHCLVPAGAWCAHGLAAWDIILAELDPPPPL